MDGTLDHVMMRVADLEESLDWYRTHFDYEVKDRYDGDGFTIVYLGPEGMHEDGAMLELTHNEGETPELGDAWGHLCVRLDDLHDDWDQLMEREAQDYRDPGSCDDMYAFTEDQDGHEIELIVRGEADSLFPF